LKYLIVGAGAMGGVLAGYMAAAGKDVTILARGDNLAAIKENGLKLHTPTGEVRTIALNACDEASYDETPDVVILCVKEYTLDGVVPLLDRVCTEKTIVLPLLNAIKMGDRIADMMSTKAILLEGIAYVACERLGPGEVKKKLDFFNIVYGMRMGFEPIPELKLIEEDLKDCETNPEVSDNMFQSALRKFVRVSTCSAVLVYYGGTMGDVVANPERMALLEQLSMEIIKVAEAYGCPFPSEEDMMEWVRDSAKNVFPEYRTSMKTDYDAGRPLEVQTQFIDVYELGRKVGLEMPGYKKIVDHFGYKDGKVKNMA
tara:strand:+ start:14701 stop:15642 length:942 start_codon:yes stop_codon:yes gene_type:complete